MIRWHLDVDGVLNAGKAGWSRPPHTSVAYALGYRYRLKYEPQLLDRITALHRSGAVDVRWATTWCMDLDGLHNGLTGFGPFASALPSRAPHLTWDEVKINAALDVLAEGDDLVWTDDSVVGPARARFPQFDGAVAAGRALLIAPRESRGLRPTDMAAIEEWVALKVAGRNLAQPLAADGGRD